MKKDIIRDSLNEWGDVATYILLRLRDNIWRIWRNCFFQFDKDRALKLGAPSPRMLELFLHARLFRNDILEGDIYLTII